MGERADLVAAGQAALGRGAWREAIERFDAALELGEEAEAYEGRALAFWWLEETDPVLDDRLAAYRLFQESGEQTAAARLAMRIAATYGELKGEIAVAQGWLQRAESLLEELPPNAEHARLAAMKAALVGYFGDREAARALSQEAASIARSQGSIDLEVLAKAIEGRALVAGGEVPAGMALLDEATATATSGDVRDLEVIPAACCFMITACERIRDFDRAAEWCGAVQELCRDYLSDSLFAYCRTSYAGALVWWGSWQDAERELQAAIELTAKTRAPMVGEAVRRLAELRIDQGRLVEARELLAQAEGLPGATLGRARLALEEGDAQAAAELAERYLRSIPEASALERVAGLETLLAATLARGDVDSADGLVEQLRSVASLVETEPLRASARLGEGLVATARGELDEARLALEDAVELFGRSRAPVEAARARVALAMALERAGRQSHAIEELRSALSAFGEIGAAREAERAESQLARLAAEPGRDQAPLTKREAEVLRLVADGLSDREIAEQLVISEHTVHRHVSNIRTKLRVPSRAAAAAHAAKLGLI